MTGRWCNPPPLRVPQRLRPHVREVYGYAATGMTPGVHRGLPSSTLTLVLPIGDGLRTAPTWHAWSAGEIDTQPLVLGGLHTEPAVVVQPRAWAGVQVAVSPLGARTLFGAPAAALPTGRWDARDLLGRAADDVADRLAQAPDWPARYDAVVAFLDRLVARADQRRRLRPEVSEAWRLIERLRGDVAVGDLAAHVALGPRRLSEVFRGELGLSPKVAARLARFDAARRVIAATALRSGPVTGSLDLSRTAADLGYFDHAHLVREFTGFAGLSPSAWVREELRNVQAGAQLRAAASST